jgi:hypothetical protein
MELELNAEPPRRLYNGALAVDCAALADDYLPNVGSFYRGVTQPAFCPSFIVGVYVAT